MAFLVNVGYLLMLGAFLARDVFVLRVLLVAAQTLVSVYAVMAGVYVVGAWNALFAAINAVWTVLILRARRAVQIPPDLQPLYDTHFAALSPREFLRWWGLGRDETLKNERLATNGAYPGSLYFVRSGAVRVSRASQTVTELPAGYFVAEMSLITGAPANADVDAIGHVDVRQWATDDLHAIRDREPSLWIKIQSIIGFDLVQKIRRLDTQRQAS